MNLSPTPKVKYSPMEQALFRLLPRDGSRITSTDLMKEYYRGISLPYHGRAIIISGMRGLVQKVKANKERGFVVEKSKPQGPRPVSFWIRSK